MSRLVSMEYVFVCTFSLHVYSPSVPHAEGAVVAGGHRGIAITALDI